MYINSVLLFFWQPTVQHGVALQKKKRAKPEGALIAGVLLHSPTHGQK